KVIILDFEIITPDYIFATAALVFAMSIGYWLVVRYADTRSVLRSQVEKCFDNPDECRIEDLEDPEKNDKRV
ncbi:MAG: phosphate-starvation-inducible PsiE family protein, partial [Desulfotignum sp.]